MGEVYRARDVRLGRDVALKLLPSAAASDVEGLQRFEQEARATAALNHPNITAIYDVGTHDGQPFVVSELLEGETLRQVLARGPLPVRTAVSHAQQIARGLAAAHRKGIVHRDLKPENLFVTRQGFVKILDFGLAKLTAPLGPLNADNETTAPGLILGTVGYMSPEQARADRIDHRSDIFALGIVLYEMLSGRKAFHGASAADTLSAILKEQPPELSQIVRDVPPGVERIVTRCLEKDREDRFQSASDLSFALEAVSGFSTPPVDVRIPTKRRTWRYVGRCDARCDRGCHGGTRRGPLVSVEGASAIPAADVPPRNGAGGPFCSRCPHRRVHSRVGGQACRALLDTAGSTRGALAPTDLGWFVRVVVEG